MIVKQVLAILFLFCLLQTCLCQQLKRQEKSNSNIQQYQQQIPSQKEKQRTGKKKQTGTIKQYKGTVDYYSFVYSYEQFQDYFIASTDDENIKNIKQIVYKYFSSFIYYESIIGAFRRYMGDYIEYMVLFKSSIGKKFKVFVSFNPDDLTLELDRIEILKLSNERTNRRNCAVSQKFICVECNKNYTLYKGRCHLQQEQCTKYEPEECFECIQGFSLENGLCVQNQ